VLLLRTFSILFGGYTVDVDSGKTQFMAAKSAVLCALLFAVHPVHTESVSRKLIEKCKYKVYRKCKEKNKKIQKYMEKK
jgi:hypothetical protein